MKGKGLAILLGKPEEDEAPEDDETSKMELAAMKKFSSASSLEEKLKAFKNLIKLCGGY